MLINSPTVESVYEQFNKGIHTHTKKKERFDQELTHPGGEL